MNLFLQVSLCIREKLLEEVEEAILLPCSSLPVHLCNVQLPWEKEWANWNDAAGWLHCRLHRACFRWVKSMVMKCLCANLIFYFSAAGQGRVGEILSVEVKMKGSLLIWSVICLTTSSLLTRCTVHLGWLHLRTLKINQTLIPHTVDFYRNPMQFSLKMSDKNSR